MTSSSHGAGRVRPNSVRLAAMAGLAILAGGTARGQNGALGSAASPDGTVRIDIVSLKRSEGETTTLRFQVLNKGSQTYTVLGGNLRLVDLVGRRIYAPGVVSPDCSAAIDQRLTCYAVFGALPAGTRTVNVQFYEKMDLVSVPVGE